MAEKFRFFDAVQDENGEYDREYNAEEFTDYFKALVTTGLMKGAGNELAVTTNGSSMITSINTGIAFILGRYYENDSPLELTHDTETLGNSRIDRIVIRMDLSTEARYVKAFIKKGVASANPIAPTLTQTPNLYEISLAQVKVVGGQTFIAVNDVTDERGTDITCPWAGSNILPNFDNNFVLEELVKKANRQQENWIYPVIESGWSNSSDVDKIRFYKDEFGVVHIYGRVLKSGANGGRVFTLPVGYRTGYASSYEISLTGLDTSYKLAPARININGDGSVNIQNYSGYDRIYFDISFRANA